MNNHQDVTRIKLISKPVVIGVAEIEIVFWVGSNSVYSIMSSKLVTYAFRLRQLVAIALFPVSCKPLEGLLATTVAGTYKAIGINKQAQKNNVVTL